MSDSLKQPLNKFSVDQKMIARKILESLHDRLVTNFIATTIAATLIFIIIWNHESNYIYLAWYLITLVIVSIRLFTWFLFKKHYATPDNFLFWKNLFDAGTLMSGAAWGFVASMIGPGLQSESYMLILLFCGVLMSAAIIAYQASLKTYLLFILPIALPITVINILNGSIINITIGVIMFCLIGFLSSYLMRLNKQFIESIQLHAKNETLISNLQQELGAHETSRQALIESESRYQDIFNNATDMIQSLDVDGRIRLVNQTWLNVMEYSPDEVNKINFFDLIHPDSLSKCRTVFQNMQMGKSVGDIETKLLSRTGKIIHVKGSGTCQFKNDIPVALGCILKDVTERKEIEEVLEKTKKENSQLVEEADDVIYKTDARANLIYINKMTEEKTGYSRAELLKMKSLDFIAPDHKLKIKRLYLENAKTGIRKFKHETPVVRKNGEILWGEMSVQCLFANEKVQEYQIVVRDITERKKMEQSLISAKENALVAKATQEQFIASVSHEIRTPMNAVTGFIELLSNIDVSKEEKKYLDGLNLASKRLLAMINDLLDMSKIQSGKLKFTRSNVSYINNIKSIIETLQPEIDTKKLKVDIQYKNKLPEEIIFDPIRFDQIMQNLLSNAVKYTHKGKIQIVIELLKQHANLVKLKFTVNDTGIGIPEDQLENMFSDFQQFHEKPDEYHGTGLGLSIVKKLVEIGGGQVFANSELNKGTSIGFILLFELPENVTEIEADSGDTTEPKNKHLRRKKLKSLKLLIVDDNDMNLLIVTKIMEGYIDNIMIDTAINGQEAFEKVKSGNYDLVFMDLQMPEMNGYEASIAIRKLSGIARKVPIMALTAALPPTVKLHDAEMNDFLLKPFTREALYEKTDQLLDL